MFEFTNRMKHLRVLALALPMIFFASLAPGSETLPDEAASEGESAAVDFQFASPFDEQILSKFHETKLAPELEENILDSYAHLDPNHEVPTSLLKKVVLYYHQNLSLVANRSYVGVVDFSRRSTQKRLFLINMNTGVVWAIRVAHGKGSDARNDGYARSFSNGFNTNASSVGFYKTAEIYSGKHGLSLRMDGLSGSNSNVRARAIVVHGAEYVREESVVQGRSWGCFAVPPGERDRVVALLKNGSIIYAGLETN